MTIAGVLAAIAGIGAMVSGIVYLVKRFSGTEEQASDDIAKKIKEEKDSIEKGGRPQW